MRTIRINCDCGQVHEVIRDKEAPENATSMGCNWCPTCENSNEYYDEWYNFDEDGNYESNDPDQLVLFSIADNVLKNHTVQKITQQCN